MKNLYKIRKEKHMSQLALAMKLGISQEAVSAYENGKTSPSVDTLISMCDIFNVSSDFLLDRTDVRLTVSDFCSENLSPDEMELISLFRKLPHPKKSRALGILCGMSE